MMKIIKIGQFKTNNPARTIECPRCNSVFETDEYDVIREWDHKWVALDYLDVEKHYAVIDCPHCHKPTKTVISEKCYEADDPYHR